MPVTADGFRLDLPTDMPRMSISRPVPSDSIVATLVPTAVMPPESSSAGTPI